MKLVAALIVVLLSVLFVSGSEAEARVYHYAKHQHITHRTAHSKHWVTGYKSIHHHHRYSARHHYRAKHYTFRASRGSTALNVVTPLAAKAVEIVGACRARVVSAFRPGAKVAGTNHQSLHAVHKAVDVAGDPACIYSHLQGWPGGYSKDYSRVRHVHISYEPGGREWGARFVHGGGRHHHHYYHRYARRY